MDNNSIKKESKIYVAGHNGMVGSAIIRKLKELGYHNILSRTIEELDLRDSHNVNDLFESEKPDYVFLAAAKVGGIYANMTQKAEFLYENIQISTNIIHSSKVHGVKKLINLGSSCIYPKETSYPIKETQLLTSPLEETNDAYALAIICALKMCQYYNEQYETNFMTLMPCNLYGTGDNYHPKNSHVLPALIRKFVEAKENNSDEVVVWGTGHVYREFLHVDDLAEACIYLFENKSAIDVNHYINVGSGREFTIREIVELVAELTGFQGNIKWDNNKPDGVYRKILDSSNINDLGWHPKIDLKEGLTKTIQEFASLNK